MSFNKTIEKSIVTNWNYDALTDYKGATLQFNDVARKIEKVHILLEQIGIKKGDKVAICGRNSAHWAVAFLATLTHGAVAVPILHEFNAEQIHNIVNHSESRILFVGDVVAKTIDATAMPDIEGIIYLPDFSLLVSRSDALTYGREHLNELFGKKYPRVFKASDVHYYEDSEEELALINYTSGTTGFSKGVMLPYRALTGNIDFILEYLGHPYMKPHTNMLSILPMAHMYGMAVEFLYPFIYGIHIFFLTRLPSPAIIAQAFSDIRPSLIVAVPLIIEKIIRKKVFPKIQNNIMRLLLTMPVISKRVKQKICEQVYEAFGGNFYEIIIGGAALNQEVESFLRSIDFPYTVGYGTTECAPLIAYSDYKDCITGSCGTPVKGMEVRILSRDPEHVEGERRRLVSHRRLGNDERRRPYLHPRPQEEHALGCQRTECLSRRDRRPPEQHGNGEREHRGATRRQVRGHHPSRLRRGPQPGLHRRRPFQHHGAEPQGPERLASRLQQDYVGGTAPRGICQDTQEKH